MRLLLTTPPIVFWSLVILSLPSCSTQHQNPALQPSSPDSSVITQQTYYYNCPGSPDIPVSIKDDVAWIFLPGKTINLPHVRSGSGAKYSDGINTFWSKGEEAYFQTETGKIPNCRNNRRLAIWEHAKLTGVDFRAVGNEPGWMLELRPYYINYMGDYGETRQTFVRPEPESDREERQTVFRVDNGSDRMTIILKGKECFDTMSGEKYETTVIIRQYGNRLQGCGKALH
ncbi:MliC family protein [Desulfopila aestuarii]|uniref:Membrane-bound lysozyme-inhibitor of c-type lysozyme n=1 Tax=Desulfopila aestuarii DSM 18488 TaxID=1121416 RepID=A0A1M7Y3S8_9BACT|nr:MliC family protein [Desulfopila aestuarii]SHO46837.1 Membrane-bound lysozyme-inhibitor of c-type lysozyme [Desulfopila aestuarii DSM 18488]